MLCYKPEIQLKGVKYNYHTNCLSLHIFVPVGCMTKNRVTALPVCWLCCKGRWAKVTFTCCKTWLKWSLRGRTQLFAKAGLVLVVTWRTPGWWHITEKLLKTGATCRPNQRVIYLFMDLHVKSIYLFLKIFYSDFAVWLIAQAFIFSYILLFSFIIIFWVVFALMSVETCVAITYVTCQREDTFRQW